MNSLHFDGRLAASPVLTRPSPDMSVTKFTLIRNEHTGKDEVTGVNRPERIVAIQFTMFGKRGEALAQHSFLGDQIIVTARVENNNYLKDGVEHFSMNFIAEDFSFGAPGEKKRAQLDANRSAPQ